MSLIYKSTEEGEHFSLDALRGFFEGRFYPVLVAVAVVIGYISSAPLGFFVAIALSLSFALTVCDSIRPMIMPLFSVVFILSPEHGTRIEGFTGYLTSGYNGFIFITTVSVLVISLLSFVFRNILQRVRYASAPALLPTLLFAAVLVANGMGSDAWSIGDLLFGLVEASVFFILFYLVYFGALEDDTDGLIDYVIFCSALTVLVLAADMVYFFAVTPDLFNADGAIMKEKLEFGFGISNSLGFCASVFLPVCVFGVNRARGILRKVFYFVATAISLVLVVVSLCRNALLFSGIALVLAFIICSFFGEGRRACRVIVFLGTVICGALLFVYWDDVIRITTEYINRSTLDSGRFKLWGYALDKFDVSHLLGEGFLAIQDYEDIVDTFRFVPIMAHNTPLQMLVSCGIVGLLLYCIYRVATLWPLIKRPSFVKIMLASPVLMTVCESLLDNFIFYIYMAFPYVVFLAIIHKIGEEEKSRDFKI